MSNDPKAANAQKIIVDADVKVLVQVAHDTGTRLARELRLTTSQIRNIFGEVRRIENDWPMPRQAGQENDEEAAKAKAKAEEGYRRVVLLQPKLAYQAKRERGSAVEELRQVLDPCIDAIREARPEDRRVYFQHFVDFFEAILAYHKAAGGN